VIQSILVPLDGSHFAENSVGTLLRLLEHRPAAVTLMRIVEAPPDAAPEERAAAFDEAREQLEKARDRLAESGASADVHVVAGDPAERILAEIEERDPDLVAMSTHGRSGITRWVRGSVAERVLRNAKVPVLLSTPASVSATAWEETAPFRKILFPHDGSAAAGQAAPTVIEIAKAHGAEVTLLHVHFVLTNVAPTEFALDPAGEMQVLEERFADLKATFAAAEVPLHLEPAFGHEASEILDAAADHDLIAMTTHGRSGLSRWLFGSVAEQVIRHCDRPLLMVRTREEE